MVYGSNVYYWGCVNYRRNVLDDGGKVVNNRLGLVVGDRLVLLFVRDVVADDGLGGGGVAMALALVLKVAVVGVIS